MSAADLVYFSAADLAERYSCHPITIWKWAASGRLPKPVKLLGSRCTRWRSDDIEAYERESPSPRRNAPPHAEGPKGAC